MQKSLTQLSIVFIIALSSCVDSGVNPEWATWHSYELAGRISVLVPPDWDGPEYSYYDYLGMTFRHGRNQFTFYCGPSLPYWFYGGDLPEYVTSPTTIGGRQATITTWFVPYDTTYVLYLWVEEVDKDLTRYAVFAFCHARDSRDMVRKVLATVGFKKPKLVTSGLERRERPATPVVTGPGARLTRQ